MPDIMMGEILLYTGAALTFIWGLAHLLPTKSIVRNFGDISEDNKNILRMEWIIEGVALIFIGLLVAMVTIIEPTHRISAAIYVLSATCLVILAIVSLFTGFRINFILFQLCPVIFASSTLTITAGWILLR